MCKVQKQHAKLRNFGSMAKLNKGNQLKYVLFSVILHAKHRCLK